MDFNTLLREALIRAKNINPTATTTKEPMMDEGTTVSPFTLSVPRRSSMENSMPQSRQPVEYNYNNTDAAMAAVNGVKGSNGARVGSANPGIWSLLPERMQNGNLRNIIGALGDAFLVQSGNDPTYGPRKERERMGAAMAGYNPEDSNSVQAAIQRVAATGAPDAMDTAQEMQREYNNTQLRRQGQEQTAAYRQGMLDDKARSRIPQLIGYAGQLANTATTPEQYARIYAQIEAMAKGIDPDFTAADLQLLPPEFWEPGMRFGVRANEQLISEDKEAQRETSERNVDVNAASRERSAGISAGARVQSSGISAAKPTNATILADLTRKQASGRPLTPAEKRTFDYLTTRGSGGSSGGTLSPGLTPGSGRSGTRAPAPKKLPPILTPAQARAAKPGTVYRTTDGRTFTR
jgi:hypothetical protein